MTKRTILIIGAGASNALHPQFALGGGLLQQISDRVTDRTSIHHPYLSNLLKKVGFDYSICWDFVSHLDEYSRTTEFPSIDGFLDEVSTYPELGTVKDRFVQIGKFSIMFHVLGYEAELKNPNTGGLKDDAWLHEVAKFIDDKNLLDKTVPNDHDLKIITFNYDRNIEHFLYNHTRFENRKNEIKLFIDDSLVHIYGKIGNLEWQDPDDFFEFGEDNAKADKIFHQKNAIGIMYLERMGNNLALTNKCGGWIHTHETAQVCTFGFNFDLINYRLLSLQNLGIADEAKFIANIYPYNDNEFKNRRLMANRIRNIKHDAELTYLSCTEFLKQVLNFA